MSRENLKNTEDLDRLADDNIYSVYVFYRLIHYLCMTLINLIFPYGLIF